MSLLPFQRGAKYETKAKLRLCNCDFAILRTPVGFPLAWWYIRTQVCPLTGSLPQMDYTMPSNAGIARETRTLLDRLHREAEGLFTVGDASRILSLDPIRARRLLAHLASQGWLARVRRGLYSVVPLGASGWHEDPWVVATKLFSPCYIGGWSAAEHWDLTEQVFRDVVVVTATSVRHARVVVQDTPYRLKFTGLKRLFGTAPVWRGATKVVVSDPSRTVIDLLDDPTLGGGIRHATQILRSYFSSEHRDDPTLLRYATRLGNRTVFKRLGFLTELLHIEAPALIEYSLNKQSSGLSLLDPSIHRRGRILKRWNLRVNADLHEEAA